jgi:hypothetical protein
VKKRMEENTEFDVCEEDDQINEFWYEFGLDEDLG